MIRLAIAVTLWLLVGCSGASEPSSKSNDAAADATDARSDVVPDPVDGAFWTPQPPGPDETPCKQTPADTFPLSDDCFAYELADRCGPYFCGRTVHYFCNGGAMPLADCQGAGTTYHDPSTQGFCCTAAACVRYKSGDALCPPGKIARSCPTVGSADPGAGCTQVSASEKGDPIYCCAP
jgi:hypothetical protein